MRVGRTSIGSRVISMLLVICMVFGMVPLSAFAAESATAGNVDRIREYAENLLNSNFSKAASDDPESKDDKFSWDTEGKTTNWRYYTGVMLDALLLLGVDSNAGNALEFAKDFLDTNTENASKAVTHYITKEVDSVPPALVLFDLLDTAEVTESDRAIYVKAINYVYGQLENQTKYSQCGGNFLHKMDNSSWATWNIGLDGVYMAQPFLMEYAAALEAGKITNSVNSKSASDIYKEVYDRLMWVADSMYDSNTGLYHHGWCVEEGEGNGHFWSRGIGWYAAGLVMCIDLMPAGQYKTDLISKAVKLFDGMLPYQDASGLWYNVVNRDDDLDKNELETSGTALMAYAMMKAYNEEWVSDSKYATAAEKAFNGIVSEKLNSSNTQISGIYLKSGVGTTDSYYCGEGYETNEAKGVGGVIMAAAEVDKYLSNTETFTTGVVVAPEMTIAAGATTVDTSNIKVSLLGSQGTIQNGVASQVSYEIGTASNGKATVTVKNGDATIGTFEVKVVDPSVPAEDEGTLGIESEVTEVPDAPEVTAGSWVEINKGGDGTGAATYNQYFGTTIEAGTYVIVDDGYAVSIGSVGSNKSGKPGAVAVTVNADAKTVTFASENAAAPCLWTISQVSNGTYQFTCVYNDITYYIRVDSSYITSKTGEPIEIPVITTDAANGNYGIEVGSSQYIYYDGSAFGRNKSGSVNLYKATTASGTPKYALLTGDATYVYPTNTETDILAAIQADYTIQTSASSDGSDPTDVDWDDDTVTYTWDTTLDVTKVGTYTLSVKVDGKEIGTIPVLIYSNTVVNEYDVSLSVEPGAVVATVGDSATQLNATVTVEGLSGYGSYVSYSGGSSSVATVSESGLVTIVGAGSTTITATVQNITYDGSTYDADDFGTITVTIPVVVNAEAEEVEVSYSITGLTVLPGTVEAGQSAQATATAVASDNSTGHIYTFTYAISGGTGATINSTTGAITTTAAGTYTITATLGQVDGSGSFNAGTVTKTATLIVTEAAEEPTSEPTSEPTDPPATVTATGTLNMSSVTVTKEYGADDPTSVDAALLSGLTMTVKYSDGRDDLVVQLDDLSISGIKTHDTIGKYIDVDYVDPVTGANIHTYITVTIEEEEEPTEPPTEPTTPPSGGSYQLVTGDINTDGGEYVIVYNFNGTYYALKNDKTTDGASAQVIPSTVTIANDRIVFVNADDEAASIWTFDGNQAYNNAYNENEAWYLRGGDNAKSIAQDDSKTIGKVTYIADGNKYTLDLSGSRYLHMSAVDTWIRTGSGVVDYVYLYQWVEQTAPTYSMTVAPATSTLKPGENVVLNAALVLGSDPVTEGVTYTWNHNGSDGAVVGNGASATFTAGSTGETVTVTVTATVDGEAVATATATVKVVAVTGGNLSKSEISVANGEAVSLDDITLTLNLSDGSTKTIPASELEIVGLDEIDTTQAGEYTVTVKYTENGVTVSDTITVTVEAAGETPPSGDPEGTQYVIATSIEDGEEYVIVVIPDPSKPTEGIALKSPASVTTSMAAEAQAVTVSQDGKTIWIVENASLCEWTFNDPSNKTGYVQYDSVTNGNTKLRSSDDKIVGASGSTIKVYTVDASKGEYTLARSVKDSLPTAVYNYGSNGWRGDFTSGNVYLYKLYNPDATVTPVSATVSPSKVNVPNSGTVDLSGVTMEVTMSDGSKKTIQNADLTYDISGINTAVAKEYTVPVSYTEGGKTVTANVTVVVAAASGGNTETSDLWKHNFSVDGATDADEFFTIKGNLTTSYDGEYGDLSFDTALKIESSTNIAFTAPNDGTVTLVFNSGSANKDIKINGTSYTIDSKGVLTVPVTAGNVTITKDDSVFLFYMEYASAVTDGVHITAPGPLYIAGEPGWVNAAPTHTLQYTVRHDDQDITSGYTIEWTSLDESVVRVDENGVITGLKSGTTSVTAKVTIDGEEYSDTVQVTVVGPGISSTEEMALIFGETGKDSGNITATVYAGGSPTDNYTLGYFSSNESVATVDQSGVVTAVGKGEATIYTYVSHVNGYQIYSGTPSVDAVPNIYDTTKVTVTAKEVVDAHLNSYDYIIHTVDDPANATNLVNALTYKPSVGVEGGVTDEEGLILTVEFNTGEKRTIHYGDEGLTVDWSGVDFSAEGVQNVMVTYVDPVTGAELFRDTIWVHVEAFDYTKFDGVVTYEDGIHFVLDTDGINVNEEYVIVPGDASVALRNPSDTSTNSGAAASTSVTLANGIIESLVKPGTYLYDGAAVDYLTMNERDVEYTSWLLDTFVEDVVCPDGVIRTQMNASSLLRYLGLGRANALTQVIHPNVGHVYLETVSEIDGEYRIVLGFSGLENVPYYLGYENGIWTATAEETSVYLYNKHIEVTQDFGINYDLTPGELTIPEGFVANPIIPDIIYNESNQVPSDWCTIVWSSSDTSVATVDQNGVVTGIKPGTATISATLYDVYGMMVVCTTHNVEHITKTVEVTVTDSNPTPVLDPDEMTIGVGTMPNFSKVAVMMTFPGTTGEYDYAVPFDQLNFKLADAEGTAADGTKMDRFDNTVPGTYIVPVTYAGQNFELTVHVVEDPYAGLDEADSIPGFPDAGSVRMNKTAKGVLNFSQTGVTKLELTMAGVSTKNSVDVVLIVDVSNSMGWTTTWFDGMSDSQVEDATDSQKIPAGGAGTGTDKLALAMSTADKFADILLNVDGGDNTISFVTFAGADRDHGGSSDHVDSVRTPMVGISDYSIASDVFANTMFTSLEKNGTGATYKLQIGGYDDDGYGEAQVSGTNRGNTNYDFAFGEAIDAVNQLKAKWEANNEGTYEESGRQIHVVFMTDGAPSHYNGKRGNGNANDTLWSESSSFDSGNFTDIANNNEANWLTHIQNYNLLANELKGMIDSAYTVAFDMAHGGFGDYSYGLDEMQRVLEGLAKNTIVPVEMADNEEELDAYLTSLARALAYAGSNAQVTDVIGGNFSLFTGTSMYSSDITDGGIMSAETLAAMQAMSFPITVNSYRLVTYSDIGSTNASLLDSNGNEITVDEITEAHLGLRFNEDPEILEQITFSADGTEAYSSLNPGVNIMGLNDKGERVINAESFIYTATLDTVIHEGVETVHAKDETINWKIGTITDHEVAIEYYAYLDGSLDNPREAVSGAYATNEYAYAEYVDVYGKYVKRYYGVPQMAWGAGNVTVRFFLVNENGQYVNRAGVTFTNPANRIFLDGRAHYEAELNNSVTFTALNALAQAGLAGNNTLYDVKAGATVTNSTTAGQGGVVWVMDNSLNNIANLLTYVDSSNNFHSNVVIDIPVIMTSLGESERPMADKTVVIDYGKPMDIDVFGAEEKDYATGYPNYRNDTLYWYDMEVVGFAPYSASHDLRDYVNEKNVNVFEAGSQATYNTANGKYSVISKNGDMQVRFTPTTILNEVEQVFVAIKFQEYNYDAASGTPGAATEQFYYMFKQLNIIPATVVYYETDGNMGGAFSYSGTGWTEEVVNGNVATESQNAYTSGSVYGNDSSYNGDTTFSNGSSYVAAGTYVRDSEGNITHPVSTSFTFTGTGFDIIGRTGKDQGSIKVTIVNNGTKEAQTISAICKGQEELYQVPVLSVNTLAYGTYTVTVTVLQGATYTTDTSSPLYQLNMGNQFYFDAVRVFGAMTGEETIQTAKMNGTEYTTSDFTVESIYAADGEANAYFEEVRDQLIDAGKFSSDGSTAGVMYMDDHNGTVDITNYQLYGANDEVYLKSGNAIAFSFELSQAHTSFDLGMKSADSQSVTAKVTIVADGQRFEGTQQIGTSTAQFYDLLDVTGYTGTGTIHVVIENAGEGVLSLTDLKVAGSTAPVVLTASADTLDAARFATDKGLDVIGADFGTDSVRVARSATMQVITEANVESLKITNAYGEEVWFSAVSTEAGGQLIWTVVLRPTLLGDQSFTITGFNADGEYGQSQFAVVSVELY